MGKNGQFQLVIQDFFFYLPGIQIRHNKEASLLLFKMIKTKEHITCSLAEEEIRKD